MCVEKLINASADIKQNGIGVATNYGIEEGDAKELQYIVDTSNAIITNGRCVFDLSIVRGQGYYTGTVYEAYTDGFGGAIGGGGRYDKMVEKLIGINVPTVGFGMGFEPVNLILTEREMMKKDRLKIALIYNAEDDYATVLKKKKELMQQYSVSTYLRAKNMKAMLYRLKFANFDGFMSMQDTEIKMI